MLPSFLVSKNGRIEKDSIQIQRKYYEEKFVNLEQWLSPYLPQVLQDFLHNWPTFWLSWEPFILFLQFLNLLPLKADFQVLLHLLLSLLHLGQDLG